MQRRISAVFSAFSIAAIACMLTGCAGLRLVETDVTAFHNWAGAPPAAGTEYRFERLPSQQAVGVRQDYVESVTRAALSHVPSPAS